MRKCSSRSWGVRPSRSPRSRALRVPRTICARALHAPCGCASHPRSSFGRIGASRTPRASSPCWTASKTVGAALADGVLLVDKPAGLTSHDVVAIVRRLAGQRRVGHAGTLDPFATGLLVLLLGRATRLLPYLAGEPKAYDATIAFGHETDTDDLTGAPTTSAPLPERSAIDAALSS